MLTHVQLELRKEERDNDITTALKLKVTEAHDRKDVGKGIARIDYNVMRSIEGDIIEICGKKKTTAARCVASESVRENGNRFNIGIDILTRYNAGVAIGDTVNIRKINVMAADMITIKPLTVMAITKNSLFDERYLCDSLRNVPIRFMDVVVIPYFKFRMAFTVISIIPFNSDHIDFSSSAFTVTTNTKFLITY
jgi:transitional endoplasmic reticulum ATPase